MNNVLVNTINIVPLKLLRKIVDFNPLIANYHMISDQKLPYVCHLYKYRDVKSFAEDMDFFSRNYHTIGLLEFLDHIKLNHKLTKNTFLLTFDDGFSELYSIVAPILLKKKITATIFITKNYLDNLELGYDNKKSLLIDRIINYKNHKEEKEVIFLLEKHNLLVKDLAHSLLQVPYANRQLIDEIGNLLHVDFNEFLITHKPYITSGQVQELIKEGITFGGHSIDHPRFTELLPEDQLNQAISSVEFLCDKFHLSYKVFAFPYSDKSIPQSFFDAVAKNFDATFGNQGMLEESVSMNIQRITIEKSGDIAAKAIKYQYIKRFVYQIMNKHKIIRNTN
ncbi:MAG: polysaccharide deacetylase family protein [Bacteroidales bacterium]|nr:polysaccharide deacetylase family protein [Bacteroidales bacterium]